MPKVIWRGATAEEYEQALRLHELVQGGTVERFRSAQKNNPTFHPSLSRVCLEDGVVVSTIHIYPRQIRIGGAVMGNLAIGDVCTHPEKRMRGYGGGCLRDAIGWAEENDHPMSMILSGVFGFYLSEKWEKFPQHSYSIDLTKFKRPKPGEDYFVRWFERDTDDLEQCMDVYDAYNADNSLSIVRTPLYWRRRLRWQAGESAGGWLVAERDARIVAYMRSGGPHVNEMCFLPGDSQAAISLFDALVRWAGRRELTKVSAVVAEDNPLVEKFESAPGVEKQTSMTTLLRFIDLERVFERMQGVMQLRYLRSGLRYDGDVCLKAKGLRQQVTLRFQGGELTLSRKPARKARTFTLTQADLFKLITGYGTLAELPLGQSDGRTKALVECLFPRGKCTFWSNDKV
jgi:predicted N-acetyltransferase YhbS